MKTSGVTDYTGDRGTERTMTVNMSKERLRRKKRGTKTMDSFQETLDTDK